jgi:hypothetical protein
MPEKIFFRQYATPDATLRAWSNLLNHLVTRLNTDTSYIVATNSTTATNVTNVLDGVDSIYRSANLIKKHVVSANTAGAVSTSNIGKVHVSNPSGNIQLDLPAGATGLYFTFKNVSTHTVTIEGNAAETIDGASNIALTQYDAVTIVWNGTEWSIIFACNYP